MIEPPLKWAGGKRWLARSYSWLFPKSYDRYLEPFFGGGAVFFALRPDRAVLSDKNARLVATYEALRDNPNGVIAALRAYASRHSDEFYYVARATPEADAIKEAARFLYLNRTCWNGLYRVNLKGEFNVPRGTKNNVILPTDDFDAVSKALLNAELSASDFSTTLSQARAGDFVFIDPPYTVARNNNGFLKYNEDIFSWADQERLKAEAVAAASRGASVLVLNAHHDSVSKLYSDAGTLHVVKRHSVISSTSAHRKGVEELAVQIGFETTDSNGDPIQLRKNHSAGTTDAASHMPVPCETA
ncbi:DNA adenine methylase [Zoogloea sp.]|uniref:DNA adenine methylase n=1 Tax=Zoogloea sp. TaxID=49181 RepID=UPI0035AF94CD